MAIGSLGQLPFTCSFEKVQTFKDLQRSLSARWATHEVIGKKPQVEWVGPGLATVSLQIRFDMALRSPPEKGLERLRKMLENKQYKTLVIGDEYLGKYVIESIDEERLYHDGRGRCIVATATVNLMEWGGD